MVNALIKISIRITESQYNFIGSQLNVSRFIRGLIDKEMEELKNG